MKKERKRSLTAAACLLICSAVWTVLTRYIDVQEIGPQGSKVGLASLNGAFHRIAGVNQLLCKLTDWAVLIPIAVVLASGAFGCLQWIKRKNIFKVDRSILLLGGFYALVASVWLFFEIVIINYRPVLMDGALEASYPSSATMIALCVMPTAMMQLDARLKNKAVKHLLFEVPPVK